MTKTEARKLAKARRAAVDLHYRRARMAGVLFALPAWQHADTVLAFCQHAGRAGHRPTSCGRRWPRASVCCCPGC